MEKDRFSIYFVHSFYLVHLCYLIHILSYAFFIIFSTSPCVHPVILGKGAVAIDVAATFDY